MTIMCTDFQGVSKPLVNSQPVNMQKHKRFVSELYCNTTKFT